MMMNHQLLIKTMLERAYKLFPKKEIFSRGLDRDMRYTYGDFYPRVCKLANVLQSLDVKQGDKIGTFAWNNHRHLELYFAITCSGSVLHTLNLRLFPEHVIHVINHAEDKIIFVDEDLLPIVEKAAPQLTTVEKYVIMTDKDELPETSLSPVYHYEKLLAEAADTYDFPDLDENTPAAMCYTTATTGLPKGVTYTHRSIYLHSLAESLPDVLGLSERDAVLPVVPMFHVLAWGLPFSCTWMGSKLVLPGRVLTPEALCTLMEQEGVTMAAGVPTIWMGIYQHLDSGAKYDLSKLRYIVNGGSAVSKTQIAAFEKKFGLSILHAYGMTETSPVVLCSTMKSYMEDWDEEEQYAMRAKQGVLVPGLEMKIVNDEGKEVAWNGKEMGELCVRGPWITSEYYKEPERSAENIKDGWLYTNDIVTIDEEGFILIQDRAKDLIKSGGEWISSVDLENTIMSHPEVVEAAVIAVPDPKWQERPMACVVLKDGSNVTEQDILDFLKPKVARYWMPDKVQIIGEIPKTSVGKFNKKALRETYAK
ncbi:long-chain fatty acid--CoA ligase [Dethiobacter alkaliphilus]|uniref:long-chain fatty acid--CoA ligase n=1 Tax=Dethiobacter alkaliphilus TaxID=427926 RepID=UPI0023EEEFC2|nr:long-chain fatty acid--CoA ligase [Dethiobacter alkaliphilus]